MGMLYIDDKNIQRERAAESEREREKQHTSLELVVYFQISS